ncbi:MULTISPECIES: TetR family transcriptional regulator [Leclercia]|uniref:TetR family transcriptional regulator n=1 Tax=Leclercia adecarboxylata TaxID=83655 RepID=A0A2C5T3B8_9ENTR|nr:MULTISPECIES: TetR family transcriptional regulator [Leclercia]ALZ98033.1 TetR family transcriptional regulator [Leclercia adecarboxylata]KFC91790.1 TetR family transcriptional regulator [Leclercia adecarboxylata ATCC 23216 = NBRC 102595]MBM6636276.1 TetR family transcriptional regulator [Leclercia adecarboxylata]MBZ3800675.1 TetR family transcriptional regulator [Leclercia adecarboxylata]MBZ3805008.1 TetR family transcriptional regulator [Leclercia adecarboxylata]
MSHPDSEHAENSDGSRLKDKIFLSALSLFAEYGLNGARMEQIAEKAGTTKRMVVYHFKTKENLYLLVLEYVYTQIRASEKQLSLDALPPVEALVQLVETTFDYHADHPDYIRIICMENMQRGRYMQQSALLRQVNRSALDLLETILERGKAKQLFNLTVNARDLHRLISSFSFHYVANSYTFTLLFEDGADEQAQRQHYRKMAVQVALRYTCP